MIKVERVLVPVDGSDSSKNAAKYAAHLLSARNPKFYLLHVTEQVHRTIGGEKAEELRKEKEAESLTLLNAYKQMLETCGVKEIELISRSGRPDHVILNVQEEMDCDIIAIGSRGRSALENVIMGSVVAGVLQEATCPVLVTRNLRKKYLEGAHGL
jgi:nucleotide-binding universal stress UspA family protein